MPRTFISVVITVNGRRKITYLEQHNYNAFKQWLDSNYDDLWKTPNSFYVIDSLTKEYIRSYSFGEINNKLLSELFGAHSRYIVDPEWDDEITVKVSLKK